MDFTKTTENAIANRTIMPRQLQGNLTVPKGCESSDGFNILGKAISTKSSYIVCEECTEERERGEGPLAFHCCPCDPVVVGFRTKAGPISCPSGSHLGPSDQMMVGLRTESKFSTMKSASPSDRFSTRGKKMHRPIVQKPVLQQQVTKAGHVPCEECEREKKTGDKLGFHFCPNDEVVVGFKTKAGPIARPSARKSGPDPGADERTG